MKDLLRAKPLDGAVQVGVAIATTLGANALTKKIIEPKAGEVMDMKKAKMISGGLVVLGIVGAVSKYPHAQSVGVGLATAGASNFIALASKPDDGQVATETQKRLALVSPLNGLESDDTAVEYVPSFAGLEALPPVSDFAGMDEEIEPQFGVVEADYTEIDFS